MEFLRVFFDGRSRPEQSTQLRQLFEVGGRGFPHENFWHGGFDACLPELRDLPVQVRQRPLQHLTMYGIGRGGQLRLNSLP